jgi:DNA-binding GntR family transcriptional regulator
MESVNELRLAENAAAEPASTYQQLAYDYVKSRIMKLEIKPGAYLTDSQIAAEVNISRTPVREAFHRLEHEGLLVSQARRGWRVYTLSLHDIEEIFDIKEALEGMVARQAARCQDEGLRAALDRALQRMIAASQAGATDAWHQADVDLHDAIFAMAANERAARIIQNINDQWHRIRIGFIAMDGRMERSSAEHGAIVAGILAGDGDIAESRMRSHLNNVRQDLVRLLVNLVLPFVQEGV